MVVWPSRKLSVAVDRVVALTPDVNQTLSPCFTTNWLLGVCWEDYDQMVNKFPGVWGPSVISSDVKVLVESLMIGL
jgi:hypothetical protein